MRCSLYGTKTCTAVSLRLRWPAVIDIRLSCGFVHSAAGQRRCSRATLPYRHSFANRHPHRFASSTRVFLLRWLNQSSKPITTLIFSKSESDTSEFCGPFVLLPSLPFRLEPFIIHRYAEKQGIFIHTARGPRVARQCRPPHTSASPRPCE